MNKLAYVNAEMQLIEFDAEDIIATSSNFDDVSTGPDDLPIL